MKKPPPMKPSKEVVDAVFAPPPKIPGDTILVCGGRDFCDVPHDPHPEWRELVYAWLDHFAPVRIVHGAARGADTLADDWARLRGVECKPYPADWVQHGFKAGPIRNGEMLSRERMRLRGVVAFPGDKGTTDMVQRAMCHVPVVELLMDGTVRYHDPDLIPFK